MYRELALGTGWVAGAGAVGALLEYSVFFPGYKNSLFCSAFQTTALVRASNRLSCCLLQPDVPHVSRTVPASVTRRCGRAGRPVLCPVLGPEGRGISHSRCCALSLLQTPARVSGWFCGHHGSCASAVASQQLLARPQKSLLASAQRRSARSELTMRLLCSIWH